VQTRTVTRLIVCAALAVALPAFGQSGLRVPERGEPGLDPSFARGWLAPEFDRFGFANFPQRAQWSYSFGERNSLGMSYNSGRDVDASPSQFGLFGRYWFSQNWSFSAEALSREPGSPLRLQDFRFGVQRRF
jgi:hypothetical protein